jgi:hypothetical protein
MWIEPGASVHLHSALKGRLRNNDRKGEIELYYELLSLGHSVGEILSAAREVAPPSGYLKRFRFGKPSSIGKWTAFLVIYTMAVSSASIASFSILHGGGDAEPATAPVQSGASNQTQTAAMPSLLPARLEAVVEPPTLSRPDSGSLQKIEAGVQETVFASPRGAEAPQQPNTDPPDTSERLTDPAVAPDGPAHEPTTPVVQFPPEIPTGSAETAPHSDTRQLNPHEPLEATPKNEAKAAAIVPARNASAALPSRAHAAKKHKANAPRRYAEPRRRIRQQAPASSQQPVHYGQQPGSYYTNSNRGYGYGGPAPNSDTGG